MKNPIRGQRISWKFIDGPTAGKGFEHDFHEDGTLSYKMEGSDKSTTEKSYEVAQVAEKVFAVAYLASSGWTLTTILDFETGSVVGFASNDKQLVAQHGTFHVIPHRAK
jgi:hypothetical protein